MEISRPFEVRYRVRFDEAGATGCLRPSGLLRFAQDLAWQHSEAAGFDRAWYEERDAHWLVRGIGLRVGRLPGYGDEILAITEVTGWRRISARRHTRFVDDGGSPLAEADTEWVLLSRGGRPLRVPDEITRRYASGMTYRPEKIDLPAPLGGTIASQTVVHAADLDPLGHLNNAAYLDLVDEAVAGVDGAPAQHERYSARFIRPVLHGASLSMDAWRTVDGRYACRISGLDGSEAFRALMSDR